MMMSAGALRARNWDRQEDERETMEGAGDTRACMLSASMARKHSEVGIRRKNTLSVIYYFTCKVTNSLPICCTQEFLVVIYSRNNNCSKSVSKVMHRVVFFVKFASLY